MTANQESMLLDHIVKDARYSMMSVHDLKVRRANMINVGTATTYDLACIQYWIMKKEERLPWAKDLTK